jgi:hypothetical protein
MLATSLSGLVLTAGLDDYDLRSNFSPWRSALSTRTAQAPRPFSESSAVPPSSRSCRLQPAGNLAKNGPRPFHRAVRRIEGDVEAGI